MPRSTYRELFDVYTTAQRETSPEDWVLIASGIPALVVELGAAAALQAGALLNEAVTHRGHCSYTTQVKERPDASLLVSQEDGRQYLVLRIHEGRHLRGGHGELTLDLNRKVSRFTNLRRT